MIDIKYADPPEFIVFSIANKPSTYALSYNQSAVKPSSQLFEVGKGNINTNNVDEWIRLHTFNSHSLQTLQDLAAAFKAGSDHAYNIDDLHECVELSFEAIKKALFFDGYASRYAELFDIECSTESELRAKLREEVKNKDQLDIYRLSRFINACSKIGLNDIVQILEKVLDQLTSAIDLSFPDSDTYDRGVKRLAHKRIDKHFIKHKKYDRSRVL